MSKPRCSQAVMPPETLWASRPARRAAVAAIAERRSLRQMNATGRSAGSSPRRWPKRTSGRTRSSGLGTHHALRLQGSNPADATHAQLWQAWSLQRAGHPLPPELADMARRTVNEPWPRPALALAVGALTPEQLLADAARDKQGDALEFALAEAWFHLGQRFRLQGDAGLAREAFEKARARGITTAVEHAAAGFELAGGLMRP